LSSRLRQLAQREFTPTVEPEPEEQCDLCGKPIPAEHRHLLEVATRELMCACQPCSILFDRGAASEGRYRLVRDRRLRLVDFELDDQVWEELRVPVEMAFFFHSSEADRVQAFYPSPAGPTESLLELDAWSGLVAANPVLGDMVPDVEALLVNRARGARQHYLVPIDDCYRLVGLIRTRWRGFTGGKEVWLGIAEFFEDLDRRSKLPREENGAAAAAEGAVNG
jgi:hypothetical protein